MKMHAVAAVDQSKIGGFLFIYLYRGEEASSVISLLTIVIEIYLALVLLDIIY